MARAINEQELQMLPVLEEIGELVQRTYRLVTNIMENPDGINQVRSLVSTIGDRTDLLRNRIDSYEINLQEISEKLDKPVEVTPIDPEDGKERVYWGPDDARKLKNEIVEEVVERMKEEFVPEEEYVDREPNRGPAVQVNRTVETPSIVKSPEQLSDEVLNRMSPTQLNAHKKSLLAAENNKKREQVKRTKKAVRKSTKKRPQPPVKKGRRGALDKLKNVKTNG